MQLKEKLTKEAKSLLEHPDLKVVKKITMPRGATIPKIGVVFLGNYRTKQKELIITGWVGDKPYSLPVVVGAWKTKWLPGWTIGKPLIIEYKRDNRLWSTSSFDGLASMIFYYDINGKRDIEVGGSNF